MTINGIKCAEFAGVIVFAEIERKLECGWDEGAAGPKQGQA